MPGIARHQIVGAGGIGTFQEPIVIGIAGHSKTPRRHNKLTTVTDELQQLETQALADLELRAEKNVIVLVQDRLGHV